MIYQDIPPLTQAEIEKGRVKPPEKDYPSIDKRLYISRLSLGAMIRDGGIFIPDDGPWHITSHPNRQDGINKGRHVERLITNDNPASDEEGQKWRDMGLWTDTANRALHPRFWQLLTAPNVGMFTGPGFHYDNGPQRQSNLGAKRIRAGKTEYAVIKKRSDDTWGLPGGYVEAGQTIEETAFAEGWQEAGIDRHRMGHCAIRTVFSPPKGFRRDTLHSWGEEYFVFAASYDNPSLEGIELAIEDVREIADADWMTLEVIATHPHFMGTHRDRTLEAEGISL
jgi:8-oxo-dGTP pyrophosphatase MutT (NUDIX family)